MTDRLVTIGIFVACAVSLAALDLAGRARPGLMCDLSTLFSRLLARRATRVAVVLAWAWLGWHFLVTPPQ
jgi:sirohydrochlorin ferrochelatase